MSSGPSRLPPRPMRAAGHSREHRRFVHPPATAAPGISLSLNKRLSSDKTSKLLDWSPERADIQDDIAFGSYVN